VPSVRRIPVQLAVSALLVFQVPAPGFADSAPVRNELFRFTASDAAANAAFGHAVAADGNLAAVGAPFADAGETPGAGAVYVFDLATRNELFTLTAADPDSGDLFGNSVAVFGTIAIVGAPGDDALSAESGAAYVFNLTNGQQQFKLTPPDTASQVLFGWSVAVHDTVALVGAPRYGAFIRLNEGSAFLFDVRDGNPIRELSLDVFSNSRDFGRAVALDGSRILIGAPFADALEIGAIYGLRRADYGLDTIDHGGRVQAWLGYSVTIGDWRVGGAPNGNCGYTSGLVHVATTYLTPSPLSPDSCRTDQFGWSCASRGEAVLVGAPLDSVNEGTANLYTVGQSGAQQYEAVLMPAERQTLDRAGHSVAMTEELGLVGAPYYDGAAVDMGAVYVFDVSIPTPVHLLRFTVRRQGAAGVLEWTIAEDGDPAGFHVFRQEPGTERVRLTQAPLGGRTEFMFVDAQAPSGPADYWLQELSRTGGAAWHGPVTLSPAASVPALTVSRPFPNPFAAATRVSFVLIRAAPVTVSVFDLRGRLVKTLMEREQDPGTYEILWDGTTGSGARAPMGVYLLRLRAGSRERVQKVVLLSSG
jgi:hypothetical protein